jgi:signal transduction histidine kinase
MVKLNCFSRRASWLKFKDPFMESSYKKYVKEIDTKMFLGFGIFLLAMTSLDAILSLISGLNNRIVALVCLQVALPLIGLLLRKLTINISRIVFVAGLILFLYGLLSEYQGFFFNGIPDQFFYIGNIVGIFEVALTTNVQSLWHKLLLCIASMLVKMITLPDGFYNTLPNFLGTLIVTIIVLVSYIHQEILLRRTYKATYESREKLRKFQSLLSDDFPISVLILATDFRSVLYFNSFFQEHLGEGKNQINIQDLFEKFELERDLTSLGLSTDSEEHLSLHDFLKRFSLNQLKLQDTNLVMLPTIYKNGQENGIDKVQHYEIKLRKIIWDAIPSYAVIFNDVSERHMITALKLADEQKDRVIATVSHELRTPINGTLGLLDRIAETATDQTTQIYLKHCKSCNTLLLYLVNSILDLSQVRRNTLKIIKNTFDLNNLLEELKSLYIFQCEEKGVQFFIEKALNVPEKIYTDRFRLTESLINLIGNAVKFTFSGSVTLKIDIDNEDSQKLRFTVIDTGIGVKEQDQPALFRMFGKIHHDEHDINLHGVGLGLSIVKELVIALNDYDEKEKINFESEYEKGSVFTFRLKYLKETLEKKVSIRKSNQLELLSSSDSIQECGEIAELPASKVSVYESSYPIRSLSTLVATDQDVKSDEKKFTLGNVLIVDDNPFNILAASFILEKLKCNISKAFNGEECIEILTQGHEQGMFYDLILMDIQMPVLDGPQATKIIRNKIEAGELNDVPIIALTAKKSTKEEKKYYKECGMLTVLEKPLNDTKLMEAIKTYIR